MLSRLVEHGISCSYVLLNAVSYIMKQVSKVFIGAVAMLNNGTAMGRAGTAMVAMTAHAYNTPVMVCCETYKFCERAQLDSICFNELGKAAWHRIHTASRWLKSGLCAGSPEQLVAPKGWPEAKPSADSSGVLDLRRESALSVRESPRPEACVSQRALVLRQALNLCYDITPIKYIAVVVTEVGMIPPTSVPVIIREYSL